LSLTELDDGPVRNDKLIEAVSLLENIDGFRNRRAGYVIIAFIISCSISVRSFFWLIDLTTWLGLEKFHVTAPASVSFVLIFLVFVLVFMALNSLLEMMGFRDIARIIEKQLSDLSLNADELRELGHVAESRNWKQGRIYRDVVAKLSSGQAPL
jgi:hypothetical protein